ncbi:serine protease [Patescibacteria group bacterium]
MRKNTLLIIGFFIIGMFGGIFADQILWPYFIERPLFNNYRLNQSPVYITEKKEIYIQENTALQNAVEKVERMVVGIRTINANGKIIEGSGLVVTSDGLLVTLAELVPQASDFSFFINKEPVSYQILKRDQKENLALVKIENNDLQTAAFAEFDKIMLGERVFLLGTIFEESVPKVVVNEGIIKNFSTSSIETNIFEEVNLSGSVLFDIEGSVLGLNTIDFRGNVTSIPINKIKEFSGL